MKTFLKRILFAGAFVFLFASPAMAVTSPQTVNAANCEATLLGVPPWYRGLTEEKNGECAIKSPDDVGGLSNFIWKIVLNIIQIALTVVSYIAFFFILYGGFLFVTGGSNPSQIEKARKSIFNAVIGLIISLGAIAITNLIFGLFGSATSQNAFGVPEVDPETLLKSGINLVYYIAGIVAVIVIIIAGLMYGTSAGNAGRVTKAKGMILYAVIGLVILIAAYAITNFVILRF